MVVDNEPAAALDRLLSAEAALLAAGDVEGAARLVETKQALVDRLMRSPLPPQEVVAALRDRADRNLSRLGAAIRGLRSAQRTLRRIAGSDAALTTYDSLGRTHPAAPATPAVARRS